MRTAGAPRETRTRLDRSDASGNSGARCITTLLLRLSLCSSSPLLEGITALRAFLCAVLCRSASLFLEQRSEQRDPPAATRHD